MIILSLTFPLLLSVLVDYIPRASFSNRSPTGPKMLTGRIAHSYEQPGGSVGVTWQTVGEACFAPKYLTLLPRNASFYRRASEPATTSKALAPEGDLEASKRCPKIVSINASVSNCSAGRSATNLVWKGLLLDKTIRRDDQSRLKTIAYQSKDHRLLGKAIY
jgi:hypothetical protein